jgi:hypothetical protein
MSKPFTKRETLFAISTLLSLAIIIALGICIVKMRHDQSVATQQSTTNLRLQDTQINNLNSYNTTICAEYQKLYAAYKDVVAKANPPLTTSYALPGSAKGDVDQCYQPQQ